MCMCACVCSIYVDICMYNSVVCFITGLEVK